MDLLLLISGVKTRGTDYYGVADECCGLILQLLIYMHSSNGDSTTCKIYSKHFHFLTFSNSRETTNLDGIKYIAQD